MNESEWDKAVSDRADELQPLYDRMDTDRQLYYIDDYVLENSLGKEVSEVYNTKLPDARLYADKVIADIRRAEIQRNVKVENNAVLTAKQCADVEQYFSDMFDLIDSELRWLDVPGGLIGSAVSQAAIRGGFFWKSWPYTGKDGKYHSGVIPWDRRFVTYEVGNGGYNWAAYTTTKSKRQINALFPDADYKGKEGTVRDILSDTENIILIDGKEFQTRPTHKWGRPPIISEFNDTSAFLRDEGYIEHIGEGIYSSVRDLYKELFRVMTILMTHSMRSFIHNWQLLSEDPEGGDPNFPVSPGGEGGILAMKKGERLEALTPAQLKQTIIYLLNLIETRLQRGSLPTTTWGTVTQPMSAVAIKTLDEEQNSVYGPIMASVSRGIKSLCELMKEQQVDGGFSIDDVSVPSTKILNTKYTIDVEMTYISPLSNIANWQVAEFAAKWMGRERALEEVIHDQDPHKTMQMLMAEEAEQLSERLFIRNRAKALHEQGDEQGAALLAAELKMSLNELLTGKVNTNKVAPGPERKGNGNGKGNPMELFSGAGRVRPGERSSYEEAATQAQQMEVE
ncbi:hypothetical protein ACFLXA_02705 [Chloroflexota bacterium]